MKSVYIIIILIFGSNLVSAQIKNFELSPDWTSTDLNGNQHNLYNYLDSGYAVFLNMATTWCQACWTVHENGLAQTLYESYGPDSTNEMRVLFIESYGGNTEDQLHGIGTSGTGNYATDTEGNWLEGQSYPFIDDASIAVLYGLTLPALGFVGRDRLTRGFSGPSGPTVAEVYELVQNDAGPVLVGRDARMLEYSGDEISVCGDFSVSVKIQNHGTERLKSLDFAIMSDNDIISTHEWIGNLSPYEVEIISLGNVYGPGNDSLTAAVLDITDVDIRNNTLIFYIPDTLPQNTNGGYWNLENTDPQSVNLPDDMIPDPASTFAPLSLSKEALGVAHNVGGFEESDFSLFFHFYNNSKGQSIVYLDKMDVSDMSNPTLYFSHAYAQYQGVNDSLAIQVSVDCGLTWTNVFEKKGGDLASAPATADFFVPVASDWELNQINLSNFAGANQLAVRFVAVTGWGNNLWIDDIEIKELSDIEETYSIASASIFPNPAISTSTLEIELAREEFVTIFLLDQLGRTVQNIFNGTLSAGVNNLKIDASKLSCGIYRVVIRDIENASIKVLSLKML